MTSQMHLHILASGSKGNASIIESPQGFVLIDDGISYRELMRRAADRNINLEHISCIIVTHEHSDHVSGLSVLCNHYTGRMIATAGTTHGRPYLERMPFEYVDQTDEFEAAGMRIRTFPTSHDVAEPFGLRFDYDDSDNHDTVGYCTDTGVLSDQALDLLHDVRILALESNHDVNMLATGPYPGYLKQRVGGDHGHLSNTQAADALPHLIGPHTEQVIAMHISQKNNLPSLAVRALADSIDAQPTNTTFTSACTTNKRITLRAASQTTPLTLW